MKFQYLFPVTLVVVALSFSCAREMAQEKAELYSENGSATTLTVRSELMTKTWLDSGEGGSPLKVYWSDGDRINVNGQVSQPLSVPSGEKMAEADFALRSVEAPFKVVYPSSAVSDAAYSADGTIGISLPGTQTWTEGSFAPGAAVMYGWSESGVVPLHNLLAAVRITLTSEEGTILTSASVQSDSDPVCGAFRLSPESGELTAVSTGNVLDLVFEDLNVSSGGTDFYFTIPEGAYSGGLVFTFTRASDGRKMQRKWTPGSPLERGKLYIFDAVEFVPGAKDIESAAEWEEFALAVNSGEKPDKYLYADGTVRLGADIEAENLSAIVNFKNILDGQGHTLTRTAATAPLITYLWGGVRDVILAGSMTSESGRAASLATYIRGGAFIDGVTSTMDINAAQKAGSSAYNYSAGLVVHVLGGTVTSCRNEGNITATVDCTSMGVPCQIGGIACSFENLQEDVLLKNCSNSGSLVIDPTIPAASTFNIHWGAIGGIAAWVRSPGEYSVTLENCDNTGMVKIAGDNIATEINSGGAGRTSSVGGILGIGTPISAAGNYSFLNPSETNGFRIKLIDCDNSGAVSSYAISRTSISTSISKSYIGGVAGSLLGRASEYATIINCSNTGAITPYDIVGGSVHAGFCAVDGGLVGWGGYLDIDKCTVNCTMGSGKRPVVALAGGIGFAMKPFKMNATDIYIEGAWSRLGFYMGNRAIVAVVPLKHKGGGSPAYLYYGEQKSSSEYNMTPVPDVAGSSVTGCRLGGDIYLSGDVVPTHTDTGDMSDYGTTKYHYFSTTSQVSSNMVVGQGFANNTGVTVSDNKYDWKGR